MLFLAKVRHHWQALLNIIILFVLVTASVILVLQTTGLWAQPQITHDDIRYLNQPSEKVDGLNLSTPIRMILPTVNISLDIHNAMVDKSKNEWPLSDTMAEYANFTSALGNERGTLLLYGHNQVQVLRRTENLQIGDKLVLVDNNKKTWNFSYYKDQIVRPEEVGFIYEEVPFRVVIFTCNGWNDEFRRLMFFSPIN